MEVAVVVDQQRSAAIRAGQAAARARGTWIGRPPGTPEIPAEIRARIVAEHQAGRPLKAIARDLNEDQVPTARGAPAWSKNAVRRVVRAGSASSSAATAEPATPKARKSRR